MMKKKNNQDKEVFKQLKALEKKKKEVSKFAKKVQNTILDWVDIKEVTDDYFYLSRGNEKAYVKGIKITPHDIFLDPPDEQFRLIDLLRQAHNKLPRRLFHAFVKTPCNFDEYKSRLFDFAKSTDDKSLLRMNLIDVSKVEEFENMFDELTFMIFVRDSELKYVDKDLNDLFSEFSSAGMKPKVLGKTDFLNYIAWLFENPMANSFYFSKFIFAPLAESYKIENGKLIVEGPINDEEFEERAVNTEFIESAKNYKQLISQYAPTAFVVEKDHMIISDRYCSCLMATQLPRTFEQGLLCEHLNNRDIKVFMSTENLSVSLSAMIKKDYNQKYDEWNRTSDPTKRNAIQQELEDTDRYLKETIADNDRTKNLILIFVVYANTYKELMEKQEDLKAKLESSGYIVSTCKNMQEQAFRMACPVLFEGSLPKQIRENFGQPQPSKGIAGLYPYVFETLKDKQGFLFGAEMHNGGAVVFDQFYYRHNPVEAGVTRRINGGMVICGSSGSGKTVSLDLILRWHVKLGHHVIAIDPENKIFKMLRRYNGQIINYGLSGNIINTFDLRPTSNDEDEDDPGYSKDLAEKQMWNTSDAIDRVIGNVCQDFETLFVSFSDEEASILGNIIIEVYKRKGIDKDRPSFKDLSSENMPTYSDVKLVCKEWKESVSDIDGIEFKTLEKLLYKLDRICGEWGRFLDGNTTIKTSNTERKLLVFGTKHLQNLSSQLTTTLKRIMYDYAWSLCIDNEDPSVFCLDEAHTDILVGKTAERVAQFVRRGRKYNACIIIATQEPSDFSDPAIITHGKAIFNNCAYKLIMSVNRDAALGIEKLVSINSNEFSLIQSFEQGEALFIVGDRRIPIRVFATYEELNEIGA